MITDLNQAARVQKNYTEQNKVGLSPAVRRYLIRAGMLYEKEGVEEWRILKLINDQVWHCS